MLCHQRTTGAWSGWREFRVARRHYEDAANSQCSFHLQPVDGALLPPFQPGHYLTFELQVGADSDAGSIRAPNLTRCYSLSDSPDPSGYRITVKRAPPPAERPELPPGDASNHLHDHVQEGHVLRVKAPAGHFFIDPGASVPAVFVAGGVGFTPMMSMLSWCLVEQPERPVQLFHVCGPPAMMQSLLAALCEWGAREDDTHFEAFGPATMQCAGGCGKSPEPAAILPAPSAVAGNASVVDVTQCVKLALNQDESLMPCDIAVATLKGDVRLTGMLDSQAQIDLAIKFVPAADAVQPKIKKRQTGRLEGPKNTHLPNSPLLAQILALAPTRWPLALPCDRHSDG